MGSERGRRGWRSAWGRWRIVAACAAAVTMVSARTGAQQSPAQQRDRIEAMSQAQRDELLRHWEQFNALGPAEQQRIRRLHRQLQEEPDGEKLRETMNRYCQWLGSLSPYRRAQLVELEPAQRIKQIKTLLQEHAKTPGKRLNAKDHEVVLRWMEQYATEHEARLLESLPEARRQSVARLTPAMRHRVAVGLLAQRLQAGNPATSSPITDRDLADLRSRLSPETRSRLDARPAAEQSRSLAVWLRQVAKQEVTGRRGGGPALLVGFDEPLADFFEFQLADEEQDRLMSLPADEMQQKLRELYLADTKPGDPAGHRADRPGHIKKPGFVTPKPRKEGRMGAKLAPERTPVEKTPTTTDPLGDGLIRGKK